MHLVLFIDVDLETLNKKNTQSFFWHFFLLKLITSDELVSIFQTACEICEMVVPKIKDFVSKNTTQVRFFFNI